MNDLHSTVLSLLPAALEQHQRGQLDAAADLYRQILALDTHHPEALHYLGLIAHQTGQPIPAERLMREALNLRPGVAVFHVNLGLVLQAQGKFDQAIDTYQTALQLAPDTPEIYNNLGISLSARQLDDQALHAFERALLLRPTYVEAHTNLGLLLRRTGDLDRAASTLQAALAVDPNHLTAHFALAELRQAQGDLDAASAAYEHVLILAPSHHDAAHRLGILRQQQGRAAEAIPLCIQALEGLPTSPDLWANLADLLHAEHKLDEAILAYRQVLLLRPNFPDVSYGLGTALKENGDLEEAERHLRQAIALQPDHLLALNNLGNLLRSLQRYDEAIACYQRVLALEPQNAKATYNLGALLGELGDTERALQLERHALTLTPPGPQQGISDEGHILFSLALLELRQGNLAAGWPLFEHRWRSPNHDTPDRPHPHPRWLGQPLPTGAALLLWGEQGIGDEIMFAGLLPEILPTVPTCILHCNARLQPLFARSFPTVEVVAEYEPTLRPPHELAAHLPTGSLPGLLRRTLADFTRTPSPYLIADPIQRDQLRARYTNLPTSSKPASSSGPAPRLIGIAWHTRSSTTGHSRSIPLSLLSHLFNLPGIRWISLQYGDHALLQQQIEAAAAPIHLDETVDQLDDLDAFAAQIAALDHVVTIDNSTAHLAGALGIPVSVLLPHVANWRWFPELPSHRDASPTDPIAPYRSLTPWYPSLTLHRQRHLADWPPVIEAIRQTLTEPSAP